jgi:hypothetical protein
MICTPNTKALGISPVPPGFKSILHAKRESSPLLIASDPSQGGNEEILHLRPLLGGMWVAQGGKLLWRPGSHRGSDRRCETWDKLITLEEEPTALGIAIKKAETSEHHAQSWPTRKQIRSAATVGIRRPMRHKAVSTEGIAPWMANISSPAPHLLVHEPAAQFD